MSSALLFWGGWLSVALALLSPLHVAAERSFAAHMFEHEVLMLIAAPLLVASRPLPMLLWGWPRQARRCWAALVKRRWLRLAWSQLTAPFLATALQILALWIWHAPYLFERALQSEAWHALQHASFFVTALLFWEAMFRREANRVGMVVACLFATALTSGALGALMAFSRSPWYQDYADLGMTPWGLTAIEDQQLAGLLMWIPGGAIHVVTALVLITILTRATRRSSESQSSA